jgi:hypothetical protein
MAAPRIRGTRVKPLFPKSGAVDAIVYGEAPGPRGADKSGIPFFGDRSGRLVWGALIDAGRCELVVPIASARTPVPKGDGSEADVTELLELDGATLRKRRITPVLTGVALSNAFPVCPTDNGLTFRAPGRREMGSDDNLERVQHEVALARRRGLRSVVTLGRNADWLLGTKLGLRDDPTIRYATLVHPSPLGLMALIARHGKGVRMATLEREWVRELVGLLTDG